MNRYPAALGFTRRVAIDTGGSAFEALIHPDTDLDGTFEAFDADNGEWLRVNGWLMDSCEALPPEGVTWDQFEGRTY